MRPLLPALAVAGAALLLLPLAPRTAGFSVAGPALGVSARHVRVHDNFSASSAGDNQIPDPNFPGHQGAAMAIWKACVEWGSERHGGGLGDPLQPGDLGSGGANFDPSFQGAATTIGTTSENIHSQLAGGQSGVLAFTEWSPFGNGWRIRYYQAWGWSDGPGAPTLGQVDLQGVACHEYGHALGLGHTTVAGATMAPTLIGNGTSQRSLEMDDMLGVQAIYGPRSANKPRIDKVALISGTLLVQGANFSPGGNQVWFTSATPTSAPQYPVVKVQGVSSTAGGTLIAVQLPANAGPGDVLVRNNGSGHASLSNPWPFDPAGAPAPQVSAVSPTNLATVDPTGPLVTVTGTDFDSTYQVTYGGYPVDSFTVIGDGAVQFPAPYTPKLGPNEVVVETLGGSSSTWIWGDVPPQPALYAKSLLVPAGTPGQVMVGGEPGSTVYLAFSTSLQPSIHPQIVSASIGDNFQALWIVSTFTMPAKGSKLVNLPPFAVAPYTTIWFQAAVLDPDDGLPMSVSNLVSLVTT